MSDGRRCRSCPSTSTSRFHPEGPTGYDSIYVAHECGVARASGKPVIALIDESLANQPLGLLSDIEQVRFDCHDLAKSTAAITAGLLHISRSRGVLLTDPSPLISVHLQMDMQFHVTGTQLLVGLCALALIGGLIYLAAQESATGNLAP